MPSNLPTYVRSPHKHWEGKPIDQNASINSGSGSNAPKILLQTKKLLKVLPAPHQYFPLFSSPWPFSHQTHNLILLPHKVRTPPTSFSYYDYTNLWHGLSAMMPFVAWHRRKECVVRPSRGVLYHRGELRTRMGPWVTTLMEAVFGQEVAIERFEKSDEGPSCFEEAVVFRRNEGSMERERKEKVYDMMRCKARAYCGISTDAGDDLNAVIRLTLLLRS